MKRPYVLLSFVAIVVITGLWWSASERSLDSESSPSANPPVGEGRAVDSPMIDGRGRAEALNLAAQPETSGADAISAMEVPKLPSIPPELDGPPHSVGGDPNAPEARVLNELERWESEFSSNPQVALEATFLLRSCDQVSKTSADEVIAQWRFNEEQAPKRTQGQPRHPLEPHTQRARSQLRDLRVCQGVMEPTRLYMRWLERAARIHPDLVQRARLRHEFAVDPFKDLPTAADRIAAIDEVIRRRDVAVAWIVELRDQGDVAAMDVYAVMRGRSGMLPMDIIEYHAWYFVFSVRSRQLAEGREYYVLRPNDLSAAELWRQGPWRPHDYATTAEEYHEADRRGREIYQRLFGAPPE